MKSRIAHAAAHPLEEEVVRLLGAYLDLYEWPWERLPITLTFGVRRTASDHRIRVDSRRDGVLRGAVSVFINYLYLQQDPGPFLEEMVPHEVAHVLVYSDALLKRASIRKHGREWAKCLGALAPAATAKRGGPKARWDDRAIRLLKGDLAVRCGCPGDAGFGVIGARYEQGLDEFVCERCDHPYRRVARDDAPDRIISEFEYLEDEQR